MEAYRLNEYEWWAANSLEEAIKVAMHETGCTRDEVFDPDYGQPEYRSLMIWEDESCTKKITVGQLLDEMTEPGFMFCTEV